MKYSLNSNNGSATARKIVANSTPLTKKFAEKIVSFYDNVEEEPTEMDDTEAAIQNLFNTWSGDTTVKNKVAELVGVLTGFKPVAEGVKVKREIGQLFKLNGTIYAIVLNNGNYAYGITRKADGYAFTAAFKTDATYDVTRAEAFAFVKDFVTVKGVTLLNFLTNYISASTSGFMAEVFPEGV